MLISDVHEGYLEGVKGVTTIILQDIRVNAQTPGGYYRVIDLIIERIPDEGVPTHATIRFSIEQLNLLHRILALYLSPTP